MSSSGATVAPRVSSASRRDGAGAGAWRWARDGVATRGCRSGGEPASAADATPSSDFIRRVAGVYVSSLGNLAYRNDLTAVSTVSSTPVTVGTWHELQLRAQIAGPDGAVEVFYDGARVAQLSRVDALGTDAISRIQLGENLTGRTYDVAYDDVVLNTAYIQP